MKCPTCTEKDLLMSERQGIEIDYCPNCRGVWLDRGELDKLIEKSIGEAGNNFKDNDDDDKKYNKEYRNEGNYYKKKKSVWGEIFDF